MFVEKKHFVIITGGECKAEGIPSSVAENAFVIAADSGFTAASRECRAHRGEKQG